MPGKHSLAGHQPRRSVPRTIDMVDASSLVTHFLTPNAIDAGRRPPGDYIALCGVNVVPAALVKPGNGHYCLPCRQTMTTRNRSWLAKWFPTRTKPGKTR